jgi:acyl-CoA thioester hydrolase
MRNPVNILETKTQLTNTTRVSVRFNEVDSLGIVWHGHYLKYIEDGREAFGAQYGLGYLDVYQQGYLIPIAKMECDYKRSVEYGQTLLVETTFWDCDAAKIIFTYVLRNSASGEIVATGRSMQVFLNNKRELNLTVPPFFAEWKKKVGVVR